MTTYYLLTLCRTLALTHPPPALALRVGFGGGWLECVVLRFLFTIQIQVMAEFTNYAMMLSITDSMSTAQIEAEIDRFQAKHREVNFGFEDARKSKEFLSDNIEGLKRMLKKRKDAELKANFILKKEHVLLLRNMDFRSFEKGGDYVFLGVEGKRPFGNSGIESDVAEICGLDIDEDSELIDQLLYELPFAINHIFTLDILSLVS